VDQLAHAGLLIAGVVLTLFGLLAARQTASFRSRAGAAVGRVTGLHDFVANDSAVTGPIVDFETADGKSVRFASRTGSNPSAFRVGDTVRVLYDRDQPEEAKVDSFVSLWLGPVLFTALGAACLVAGVAIVLA